MAQSTHNFYNGTAGWGDALNFMPLAGGLLGRATGHCFVAGTQVVMAEEPGLQVAAVVGLAGERPVDPSWWDGVLEFVEEHRTGLGVACVVIGVGVGGLHAYRAERRRRRRRDRAALIDAILEVEGGGLDRLLGRGLGDEDDPWEPASGSLAARRARGLVAV